MNGVNVADALCDLHGEPDEAQQYANALLQAQDALRSAAALQPDDEALRAAEINLASIVHQHETKLQLDSQGNEP